MKRVVCLAAAIATGVVASFVPAFGQAEGEAAPDSENLRRSRHHREMSPMRSRTGDVNDRIDKGVRILLRQVVPYTSSDMPMCIAARELLGV